MFPISDVDPHISDGVGEGWGCAHPLSLRIEVAADGPLDSSTLISPLGHEMDITVFRFRLLFAFGVSMGLGTGVNLGACSGTGSNRSQEGSISTGTFPVACNMFMKSRTVLNGVILRCLQRSLWWCCVSRTCSEGVRACLKVQGSKSRVRQVAINYLSVACVPECENKVTRKVYRFIVSVVTSPKISGAVPRSGVRGTNYQQWVEVQSGSAADTTRMKISGSQRDPVRGAGPEPEVASTRD